MSGADGSVSPPMHWLATCRPLIQAILVGVGLIPVSAPAEIITGRVVGIADGDTLTVLDHERVQRKIRIGGIDAPEKKQPYGQQAKGRLANAVFGK